ncbi:P-loop NTPase fold protein [Crossiella cryophila]|uniref:AAA+ ATPase domain-containing protein n=1 Tax=Crossiella cryophila TaxID=43355 RepID=A0A7W7CGR1_9PSEU|nr:P-loop NTPase fold protein [Crossiella cryophila]MBB4679473.1 hypothetical protein [Crossiella cryophila]
MTKRTVQQEETWFLPDEPVAAPTEDAFSHTHIADNLRTIIRTVPGRLTIGLTGRFGVGKSTVIELLAHSLSGSSDYAVVRVSAERHATTGLERSLNYAFAEALVNAKIVDAVKTQDVLARLETSSARAASDPFSTPLGRALEGMRAGARRTLWAGFGVLLVVLAVASVVGIAKGHWWEVMTSGLGIPLATALAAASAVVSAGIRLTGISGWLAELLKPDVVTTTRPRPEAADEFERIFADLTRLAEGRRLIVAVDDVDRLTPEHVLNALNAIRSLQQTCAGKNQPVFIVSCDEAIVHDAIVKADPGLAGPDDQQSATARAFLDRLFSQRQPMPPHPRADMLAYARQQLQTVNHGGLRHLGGDAEAVLSVLIHTGVTDPRHVLRLLNRFFADYRLVLRREQSDANQGIRQGEVSSYPAVLARMTVFAVDFPDLHRALHQDEQLLELLERHIRTADLGEGEAKRISVYLGRTSLLNFIGRTTDTDQVPTLQPFLYRSQDALSRILGSADARAVRDDLVNAQMADLHNNVSALAELAATDSESRQRLDAVLRTVEEVLAESTGLDLSNAANTAANLASIVSSEDRTRLADAVSNALARARSSNINADDLITLAVAASTPPLARRLAEKATAAIDDDDTRRARDLVLLRRRSELATVIDQGLVNAHLEAACGALAADSPDALTPWLTQLSQDGTAQDPLVARTAVAALRATDGSAHHVDAEWAELVLGLLRITEVAPATEVAVPAISLASSGGEDTTLGVLALTLIDITPEHMARFLTTIGSGVLASENSADISDDVDPYTLLTVLELCNQYLPLVHGHAEVAAIVPVLSALARFTADLHSPELITALPVSLCLLVQHRPNSVAPFAESLALSWTNTRGQNNALTDYARVLIDVLDDLPAAAAELVLPKLVDVLSGRVNADAALIATLPLVPELVRTDRGAKAAAAQVSSMHQHMTVNNAGHLDAGVQILRLLHANAPTAMAATAGTTVAHLKNQIGYGGTITSTVLTALTGITWPENVLQDVLQMLNQYATNLSENHRDELLIRLPEYERLTELPEALVSALAERCAEAANSTAGAVLLQLAPASHQPSIVTRVPGISEAQHQVLSALDGADLTNIVHDWSRAAAHTLSRTNTSVEAHACRETLSAVSHYEDAYTAAVVSLLDDAFSGTPPELPGTAWKAVFVGGAGTANAVLDRLLAALADDRTSTVQAVPVLTAIADLDEKFPAPLPLPRITNAIMRWIRNERDTETVALLIEASLPSPALTTKLKSAVGTRRPKSADEALLVAWKGLRNGTRGNAESA